MNPGETRPDSTSAEQTAPASTSSRRQVLGKIGVGLFAATTGPALAQAQQTAAVRAPIQSVKRDPVTQYVRPPFRPQRQPWPALAGQMSPRPDHGETSYQGSGRLLGRKALITGGDSGIGRAAAIAYAREVVALIRAAGRKAVAIPGDLRSEAFCVRLVAESARQLGGLDILVNNAARQQNTESILDLTTENFDWTMKTNIYATFWLTKAAVPLMPPGAVIITTASVQAYDPAANLLDYAQTKAAQVAFTKSLAKQLAPRGIRVNAVAPGPFWTPLQVCSNQKDEALAQFGAQTPLGRPGQPAELAALYVALASQETSDSTGQVFGGSGGAGFP
ncbi:SDR family oxidoreductase [uncultured Deinococcus sp.]|uniref:SDR family oxidoreductase n=1 Tax=uncultured Deinococcus sp. TaxID=158789 RepID=UPI00258A7C72|nr:SDR family oxidoreductase [uncultured Deinococcus sp.]